MACEHTQQSVPAMTLLLLQPHSMVLILLDQAKWDGRWHCDIARQGSVMRQAGAQGQQLTCRCKLPAALRRPSSAQPAAWDSDWPAWSQATASPHRSRLCTS